MDSGGKDNQRDRAGERAEEHATTAPVGKRRPAAPQADPTITAPVSDRGPAAPQAQPTGTAPLDDERSVREAVERLPPRLATRAEEPDARLGAAQQRIQELGAQLDERDQALEDVGEEVARTAADLQRVLAQRDAAERATEAAQQQRASADRVAQEALAQRRALEQAVATLEAELERAQGPGHDPTKVGGDARAGKASDARGTAPGVGTYAQRKAAALERRAKEAEQRAAEAEQRAKEAERAVQEAERRSQEDERLHGYPGRARPRVPPAGQRRSGTPSGQPTGEQSRLGRPNLSTDQIVGLALLGLGVVLVLLLLAAVIGIV